MLSVEECRKYLDKYDLTDEQIKDVRNVLYCIAETIILKHRNNEQQ